MASSMSRHAKGPVILAAVLSLLAAGEAASQTAPAASANQQVDVPYAVQWDMPSSRTKGMYRIFVSEPVGPPPAAGYPVVYVLDANGYFATAVESARMLELAGEIEPALIVGVGYPFRVEDPQGSMAEISTRRVLDFTPRPPKGEVVEEMGGLPVGGAEDFYAFLKDDLSPRLARSYKVDVSRQVLFGHSLGGLFALNMAFQHPDAFESVISASPSIWWGKSVVLEGEPGFKAALAAPGQAPNLLLTVGALEASATATPVPPNMTSAQFGAYIAKIRTVENARELAGRLEPSAKAGGGRVEFVAFEEETHVSVAPAAISRALRFALSPSASKP